ncbi:MAG: ATPase, T2SS/T4P/T4SS family [Aquificota bacterium]|nr:ATPase, T2SS/T4P/T4SS family [Aquificota bacterium]
MILVGEIRDEETAEMAVRAAITGHLVLSTVHTNDAVSTIPRLIDLKVKEYMIASGLLAVTSQRLIRKVCPFCAEEKVVSREELRLFGFSEESLDRFLPSPEVRI